MSRAFVKENEDAVEELPDRPVSPHPNFVTPEGLAAIEATLTQLNEAYAAAQRSGDRTALASLPRDVRYWTARRTSAQVIAPPSSPDHVQFGSTVTIAREDGRRQTFRIVGEDEADPKAGSISFASPVARSLMGKAAGDTAGSGSNELEIVAIA